MSKSRRRLGATCITVGAACLALAAPAVAEGPDDFRTGSQADPSSDGSIVNTDYPGGLGRLVDIRNVRVDYDAGVGALTVVFDGDLNGVGHSSLALHLNLSAPSAAGACDGRLRPGDFMVDGHEVARGYIGDSRSASLSDHTGAAVAQGSYEDEDQTASGPRMTFSAPGLIGRNLRCVSAVYASKLESGFVGASRDDVKDFVIGGPLPDVVQAPRISASGITLTWSKVQSFTSYVVASSSAPEGSPGRNTTYRTVTGTSYAPPAAPGATRYYGVRADAPGAPWADPEVAITYPGSPASGGSGASPGQSGPTNGQSHSGGVNRGVIVNNVVSQNQTTTIVNLTLTATTARRVARKVLAARYGKAFARRAKRSLKLNCTPDGEKAGCRVQWRTGRSRYKGKVTITRTKDGDAWRTAIKRTAIRRYARSGS